VALVAFDATLQTIGPGGTRSIPIDDFYLVPGDRPDVEHPLEHGELIAAIDLPPLPLARTSVYLKFRDRQSYEFALVSALAAIKVSEGLVRGVRLALGGVGTKPWRARRAEAALLGSTATPKSFERAAAEELQAAVAREHNAFKVEFARRVAVRALTEAMTRGAS
jgi:xanthine dehydrogenase YagS FAD-binding subunit